MKRMKKMTAFNKMITASFEEGKEKEKDISNLLVLYADASTRG